MPTTRQNLGTFGEMRVIKECECPRCKKARTLVRLPPNFRCADIICDFCGYLAQVKATTVKSLSIFPRHILGAAWKPQEERMDAAIFFPLFLVLVVKDQTAHKVYYLSADLQQRRMFKPRAPLSSTARRAGWTGFIYDLRGMEKSFVEIVG